MAGHRRALQGGLAPALAGPGAEERLATGRAHERAGALDAALAAYADAARLAAGTGEPALRSEALRREGVIRHHRNEPTRARALCQESHDVALACGEPGLAAEALNALGGMEFECGAMPRAREHFAAALALGGERPALRSRIEQNLGILATIQGDHAAALAHYGRSLDACRQAGDLKGCAIAHHNLGMIAADRQEWPVADRHYTESSRLAAEIGDVHLGGLCRLNRAEVHLARQDYTAARDSAEAALATFDRLGSRMDKADAYRVLGVVYRETGRPVLAEARLRAAVDLAAETGSVLGQAESSRELGRLYRGLGRNQEALTRLNAAHRLFHQLDARLDLVDVSAKVSDLEGTFLAVVRDWGQSIESADSYTHGHCERVAAYAEQVAVALGLTDTELTTIRLGAYLHDLGKVKVPHEILNKPGRLTAEEFAVIKRHPAWGVELLAEVEFPWDLKPIIRWHHEKFDGTGYPDGLSGDRIPLAAQIIGIVDVFDALTTTRSYRGAMSQAQAVACVVEHPEWWRPDVYGAFLRTLGAPAVRAA